VAAIAAKILDVLKQTQKNWRCLTKKGQLKGAGDMPNCDWLFLIYRAPILRVGALKHAQGRL
jgi:hypothetical protein